MEHGESSNQTPANPADLVQQLKKAVKGMSVPDLNALLQTLQAASVSAIDTFDRTPPSRRRRRRPDVVTYRVRIDLDGTKPPLWRRLELASDLFLDDVHDVIQAAFGWWDCHLHQFGSGKRHYDHDTEYYLCPFEVEEGKTGIPEEHVRLDELLVEPRDKLFYTYDFGDDWRHTIKLEAVLPRAGSDARAVCTTGRRPSPAEDCGGVYGYELIAAATDPTNPDHADAVVDFVRRFGDDTDLERFATTPFDKDLINKQLAELGAR